MPSYTAVVAGATGLVGSACLDALLRSSDCTRVTALVRRPLATQHEKLTEMLTAGHHLPALHPMTGGAVFCALGTTIRKAGSQEAFREVDFHYPLRLAQAAREAGASTMAVVSSVGANPTSSNFYLRVKGELEEELKKLHFDALHIFRPSILLGRRDENRPGERVASMFSRAFQWTLVGEMAKYRPIPAMDVGNAMVTAVQDGKTGVHIYHFSSIRELCVAM